MLLQRFDRNQVKKFTRILRYIPPLLLKYLAKLRRRYGIYDLLTLWLYSKVWKLSNNYNDLAAYLKFRRDLGYISRPRKWLRFSEHGIISKKWQLFIEESRVFWNDEFLNDSDGILYKLIKEQEKWCQDFENYIKKIDESKICIVGNGPQIVQGQFGQFIDTHDLIIRFNSLDIKLRPERAFGSRCHVWVRSPVLNYRPKLSIPWVVMTGPFMFWRLNYDGLYESRKAENQVTLLVPLNIWQRCIWELQAPPSAGFLIITWLRDILGNSQQLTTLGIGEGLLPKVSLLNTESGIRHNWIKEKNFLK